MKYVLIGAVVIICLILVYVVVTYNDFVKKNNYVKEAFSTMDVYLKKRWDLVPNLVKVVKSYSEYESITLESIIGQRNVAYGSLSTEDKIKANKALSGEVSRLLAISESYPDLKANTTYLKLSEELSELEDDIANSRKYYNAMVREYNNKTQMFPSNIVANLFGYKEKEMYEIENEERNDVEVNI